MGKKKAYFYSESLGDAGAVFVAEKLRGNTTVEQLLLRNCGIGAVGTRALAESLAEDNITLKKLYLSENSAMGDVGAQAIALMLKKNTTLELLKLNWYGADLGAAALGEALKENCTLKTLSLDANFIDDNGADALADGLRQNESLLELYLLDCVLTDAGAASLLSALRESNSTLAKLDLDSYSIWSMLQENRAAPASAEQRARCLLFCCLHLAPNAHEHEVPSIGAVPVPVMRDAVEHAGKLHVAKRFEHGNAVVTQSSSAGVRARRSPITSANVDADDADSEAAASRRRRRRL